MKKILEHLQAEWYKYLLEILVITFGILGAFALNNWNESRKDQEKEEKVLIRLKRDFEDDLKQIESRIRLRNLVIRSAKEAVYYMDYPEGVTMDSIYYKVSPIFYTTTFDPIDHKLMESGDIHLIRSEELKHLLSTWPSYMIQLKEVEYEYLNTYRNIILPFFLETGLGRGLDHAIWTDESFYEENYWIGEVRMDSTIVPKPKASFNPSEILSNKKLESILTNCITINTVCQIEALAVKKRMVEILRLIEENLE